jgi:hypothetical protein
MTTRQDEYRRVFDMTMIDSNTARQFRGTNLKFLILTEDWCGDSSQFVPVLARLVAEIDGLEIRFLLRNEHLEFADKYRDASGRQPIPVIVVLDEGGDEVGVLLERPAAATELMASETRRFADENNQLDGIRRSYANMPAETKNAVSENIRSWRSAHQQEFGQMLLAELAAIAR